MPTQLTQTTRTLSIIIPVFNECETIAKVLKTVGVVKLPDGWRREVIVVDDGSTDSTRQKLKAIKSGGIKIIFHKKNSGKGAAVKTGIENATGEYIIIQDADLEYHPNVLFHRHYILRQKWICKIRRLPLYYAKN